MENRGLGDEVWSEQAMLDLLGIDRKTLDGLRLNKSFPAVRLTGRRRVYLASDVLGWIQARKEIVDRLKNQFPE